MRKYFFILISIGLLASQFPTQAAASTTQPSTLGQKIVAFCVEHKGQQVGNGQCGTLASHALRAVGGKHRGPDNPNPEDFVWGDLVLFVDSAGKPSKIQSGKLTDIRPGDIIQFRDAVFEHRTGKTRHVTQHMHHHTAIVESAQGSSIHLLQQNSSGRLFVTEGNINLFELKEGWLRFYRPIPRTAQDAEEKDPPPDPKETTTQDP
jgi:hypothetical protein